MDSHLKILLFVLLSVVMVFVGCVSSRTIVSSSEIPLSGYSYYTIHGQNLTYFIKEPSITNGLLSGKIIPDKPEDFQVSNRVKIYVTTDSVFKFYADETLIIELDDITKVITIQPSIGLSIPVVMFGILGLTILIAILTFEMSPIDIY